MMRKFDKPQFLRAKLRPLDYCCTNTPVSHHCTTRNFSSAVFRINHTSWLKILETMSSLLLALNLECLDKNSSIQKTWGRKWTFAYKVQYSHPVKNDIGYTILSTWPYFGHANVVWNIRHNTSPIKAIRHGYVTAGICQDRYWGNWIVMKNACSKVN